MSYPLCFSFLRLVRPYRSQLFSLPVTTFNIFQAEVPVPTLVCFFLSKYLLLLFRSWFAFIFQPFSILTTLFLTDDIYSMLHFKYGCILTITMRLLPSLIFELPFYSFKNFSGIQFTVLGLGNLFLYSLPLNLYFYHVFYMQSCILAID